MTDPSRALRRRVLAAVTGLAAAAAAPPVFARRADIARPSFETLDRLTPGASTLDAVLDPLRGKAVLVNFWASWCVPCRDEMPALVALGQSQANLELVTIAVADREADIRRFLDAMGLAPTVVVDPEQRIARAWSVGMLPTTILLDTTHHPRYRVRGELDWSAAEVRAQLRSLELVAPRLASNS